MYCAVGMARVDNIQAPKPLPPLFQILDLPLEHNHIIIGLVMLIDSIIKKNIALTNKQTDEMTQFAVNSIETYFIADYTFI